MEVFSLEAEQQFNPRKHVEKILGKVGEGDVTVACWEPGQISPYHCHPHATEIYFCYSGGGTMHTPRPAGTLSRGPSLWHPRGNRNDYANGRHPTPLSVVPYGATFRPRH